MMEPVCELAQVSKTYRDGRVAHVTAVRELSLRVHAGELVALMGPSGCGKSTVLALAGGIEEPDSGIVRLHGSELRRGTAERARRLREEVGYVFQELNLLRDLTALENVALPLELGGMDAGKARARARDELVRVGLGKSEDEFPANLSGGEQQRLAIARALIGQRRLLLADEPTGSLDSLAAEAVMHLIRSRCDDGAAAIVATHDAHHAAVADRVIYLRDGAIVGQSSLEDALVG